MKRNFISTIFLSVFISVTFTASFAQVSWTKYEGNPVLRSVNYAWDYHLIFPFVIKEGDEWKIWYTGMNEIMRIGYATSSDGITWTRYDDPTTTVPFYANSDPIMEVGAPGSWDDVGLFNPSVFFDGTTYQMWYGGWDGTKADNESKYYLNIRLGYATSPDGINWEKYPDNPVVDLGTPGSWDAEGMSGGSVIYMDSVYHLWYAGVNGLRNCIGYASSTDGIHWERDTLNNPVLEPGGSGEWDSLYVYQPYVLYNPDLAQFEMWYAGGVSHSKRHLGFATSPDGINWAKYSNNPVLSPGPEIWDNQRFSGMHVMLTDTTYKMWYAGLGPEKLQIGYATAPVAPTAITDENKMPEGYTLKQSYPNPFNPTTTIEFDIPKSSDVRIEVFNIAGQKIQTLLNEKIAVGSHKVEFNAQNLSSGVYFYRIEARNFAETRKMVYLK